VRISQRTDGDASILDIRDLKVYYYTPRGAVRAVDGVTFELRPHERFGLVGESGSGKTTIALALMRLIKPPGRIEQGEIWLERVNLVTVSDEKMRALRLAAVAMVAQGAMNSLNPVMRVRDQIADGIRDHGSRLLKRDLETRIRDLLLQVGLAPEVAGMYPHELSGGMKQRVCIAIAISLRPRVIIADEPTSALDVVVQKQVMDTLRHVQLQLGAAVILVGHDMGLMAQFVDRLGVMYAGKLAEVSPIHDIFREPLHPYTQLLIQSLPSIEEKATLSGIPGLPPSLLDRPSGCPFHPRCPHAMDVCLTNDPPLLEVRPNRFVACFLYEDLANEAEQAVPADPIRA
jgi:oligopeptide/dipeptide ABC transporter ATP-binding protein